MDSESGVENSQQISGFSEERRKLLNMPQYCNLGVCQIVRAWCIGYLVSLQECWKA